MAQAEQRPEGTTVSEILGEIEEEVYRNERMIKLNVALEYMIQLVDPKYKDAFIRAEKSARTIEDMNKILELAKKHIGQRTAISMLGI
jgi:HEPN domain-containing protein